VHGKERYTAVDDLHAVKSHHIGDGAATAQIHPTQLAGMIADPGFVQDAAQLRDVFRIGIIGAGFPSGAGEFVEAQPPAQVSGVFLLKGRGVERIKGRAHIRAEHAGIGQAAAKREGAATATAIQQLRHGIFQEKGARAGSAHAADLLFIAEEAAGGAGSKLGTGGMLTKVHASRLAASMGTDAVIANGDHPEIIYDILDGKDVGTLFVAQGKDEK